MASYEADSSSTSRMGRFALLLTKSTKLLKAVKAMKAVSVFKVGASFFSFVLSAFAYSFMMGFWFSAGFVAMLFVHEMGHAVALKSKKLPSSLPVFIPFLGAAIFTPKMDHRPTESYVGFAGPFIGSLAAFLLFPASFLFRGSLQEHLILLSYTAAFVNLFNLIPIRPLDGGRVTQIVGPWFKYVGFGLLAVLGLALQTPGMLLIWIIVLGEFRLPRRIVIFFSVVLQLGMMTMISLGLGVDQPLWVDIVDIVIATLINLMVIVAAPESVKEEPNITPVKERMKWLALYASLAIGLLVLLAAHVPFLPDKVSS